jgi:excisionase family DNA binding protein
MDQGDGKLTMSLPEFAAAMGVSKATIYDLAKRNKLPVPVLHIGEKRLLVSRKAVMTLLEGKGNETPKL